METRKIGNILGHSGGNFAGNIYDTAALSPTTRTMQGGNTQPMVIDTYNKRVKNNDCVGTITSYTGSVGNCGNFCIAKEQSPVRIRKLTPKECWRLMGFSDEDFEKAEKVNSNTQLYKQAGNSIVVDVLVAIFDSLLISGRSVWLDELLKEEENEK